MELRAAEDAVVNAEDRHYEAMLLCHGDRESPAVQEADRQLKEANYRYRQAFRAWLAVEGQ